jgi:hypothetical protein
LTLPLASAALLPIAEKTVCPSTSITCGTYAKRDAAKKNSHAAADKTAAPSKKETRKIRNGEKLNANGGNRYG